jgi:hypothetical protein
MIGTVDHELLFLLLKDLLQPLLQALLERTHPWSVATRDVHQTRLQNHFTSATSVLAVDWNLERTTHKIKGVLMQVKAISMQVHELKESENAISFSFQVVGLSLAVISVCGVGVQTCRRGLAAPNMGIVASAQVGRTRLTATDVPRYSACST